MTSIITPKLVSIDTSIIGNVAKDYFSKIQPRRKKALNFISIFEKRGLIPLFCKHHFQELLQHDNDSIAYNRLLLIKQFSQVAWIKSPIVDGWVGSIIDVQGTEITKLIENPKISIEDLIVEIRTELISYSSGESFINSIGNELIALREMNLFSTNKSRATSSISHIRNPSIENAKLAVLKRSQLKSTAESGKSKDSMRNYYRRQLRKKGDRKLENIDSLTDQLLDIVSNKWQFLYEQNQESLYNKFINSYGVEEHEVDENWTVGEFIEYAIFKEKINIISKSYDFDNKKVLKISRETIPSWFVWFQLDKKIKEEKFASGSNIIDKYLACLSFYADILIVDKRIKEYLTQIFKKHEKYSFINDHVIKLSCYDILEQQLDALTGNPDDG